MKTIFKISIGLAGLLLISIIVNDVIMPYSGYVSPSERAEYSEEHAQEFNTVTEEYIFRCNDGNAQACDLLKNIILPECNKLWNNDFAKEHVPVCYDGRIQEVLQK